MCCFAIKYSLHFNKLVRVIKKGKSWFHLCFKYDYTKIFFFFNEQKEMTKPIHVGPLHSELFWQIGLNKSGSSQ